VESKLTELVEEFPIHVVTDWLGNSPEVARKHYLQTHEEHFKKAVEKCGLKCGLNHAATPGKVMQDEKGKYKVIAYIAKTYENLQGIAKADKKGVIPPRGLEPLGQFA